MVYNARITKASVLDYELNEIGKQTNFCKISQLFCHKFPLNISNADGRKSMFFLVRRKKNKF